MGYEDIGHAAHGVADSAVLDAGSVAARSEHDIGEVPAGGVRVDPYHHASFRFRRGRSGPGGGQGPEASVEARAHRGRGSGRGRLDVHELRTISSTPQTTSTRPATSPGFKVSRR